MRIRPLAFILAVASLAGPTAYAQNQPSATNQALIEHVVVRNRIYNMKGRFELTPTVGLTVVTKLTDQYNFNLGFAYNVSDTLAFEVRGGYAYSRHTNLADQVGSHLLNRDPKKEVKETDDMSGLWELKANGLAGVRWAPLYGKISLLAELPVHFQAYLWAGAGAGTFDRESIVYCQSVESRADGVCANWLTERNKVKWLGSVAAGMRFFTHQGGGIVVQLRDYVFPDSFLRKIDRTVAEANGPTGTPAANPGLTNLVLVDLGYSFIF